MCKMYCHYIISCSWLLNWTLYFFLQAWVICSISHFYSVCCTRGMLIVWKGSYFLPNHQVSKMINISILFTTWIQCHILKWWELKIFSGKLNCYWLSNESSTTINRKLHLNELQSIRMMRCTTIIFFFFLKWYQWYNNLFRILVFNFNWLLHQSVCMTSTFLKHKSKFI